MARILIAFAATATCLMVAGAAQAQDVKCKIRYSLKGWSFIYKEYHGSGTVTCSNGQTAAVKIVSRGGGLTAGKSEVHDGEGTFSAVFDIEETLGTYVAASAGAGASKSAEGQAMTKGEVSLSLAGTGRGVEVGIAFGSFTISRQ